MQINDTRNDRMIKTALEGLTARQRTIADNVANVDTPEFKASRVSFETALKQAAGTIDQPLKMFKVNNAVADRWCPWPASASSRSSRATP